MPTNADAFSREEQLAGIHAELIRIRAAFAAMEIRLEERITHGSIDERRTLLDSLEAMEKRVDFLAFTATIIGQGARARSTKEMWQAYETIGVTLGEMTIIADDLDARNHDASAIALRKLIEGLRSIPQQMAADIERM